MIVTHNLRKIPVTINFHICIYIHQINAFSLSNPFLKMWTVNIFFHDSMLIKHKSIDKNTCKQNTGVSPLGDSRATSNNTSLIRSREQLMLWNEKSATYKRRKKKCDFFSRSAKKLCFSNYPCLFDSNNKPSSRSIPI